jgi:transposase
MTNATRWVGIDLHRRRSQVAIIDGHGELTVSRRIATDREAFTELLGDPDGTHVALEATYGWEWLADLLEGAGFDVHLAHPLRTRAIAAARVKTDAIDAKTLAHLLRTGMLPEAYIAPPELRDLRELLRHRATLTGLRTSVKNRVHTAMLIIAEIGDVTRFPTARHVCSWAGLTPSVRSSDGKARLGHISRQGSAALRWALVEAAQKITTGSGPLREKFERIAKRRGRKIAKVAVAREILTLAYYGLRDGEIRCLARRSRASAKEKLAAAA